MIMDRTIRIPKKNIEELISHARQAYPQECCGLLAGTGGTASNTYRMTNIDQSPFSYLMEPKEQFVALKDMRKNGIEMIADHVRVFLTVSIPFVAYILCQSSIIRSIRGKPNAMPSQKNDGPAKL